MVVVVSCFGTRPPLQDVTARGADSPQHSRRASGGARKGSGKDADSRCRELILLFAR